ncbi:MAG: Crp/Fnr family transcriptional regulator [Acidobacteriaceae bacterium]
MPVEYPAGATLMRQGDPAEFVRIVCGGRVKIYTSSQEGKTLLLSIASPGVILGLVSAIGQIPYETTAEAYGPCVVNEIRDGEFLTFLFRRRTVCCQVMRMLAAENRELLVNARRVALSGSVAGNVAKLLLDWGTTMSSRNGKKHFNMVLTHQEIAEMVGTTRETVTRTLAQFRQNGWIRVQGVSMEILQQEKMRNISI